MRARRGFTLVEVMAAMVVLAIGLTTILAVMTTSMRLSNNAADKNITRALINEAISDIERAHLITTADPNDHIDPVDPTSPPVHLGEFIETVTTIDDVALPPALKIPTIYSTYYQTVTTVNAISFSKQLDSLCGMKCFSPSLSRTFPPLPLPAPQPVRMLIWPLDNVDHIKYVGGAVGSAAANDYGSYAYRILYRLERDQRWYPHLNTCSDYVYDALKEESPYAGMYQLTLVVYRDIDRHGGRLEQLTDPVVVYLRDRKVRP